MSTTTATTPTSFPPSSSTSPYSEYEVPACPSKGIIATYVDKNNNSLDMSNNQLAPMQWSELLHHFDFDINTNTLTPRRRIEPDLILPGLYLGDQRNAYNPATLAAYHITHVLSVTLIPNMSAHRARFTPNIELETIQIPDEKDAQIAQHFPRAIAFIERGRRLGNVLVHCVWGMSRSATIVTAYLMYKCNMRCVDAMRAVRDARPIASPNDGFVRQLGEYGLRLRTVEFSIHFNTRWGQNLHIVGTHEALGNWKPTNDNRMVWVGSGMWRVELPLYCSQFEYKYVVVHDDGVVVWESCSNRRYDGSRRFVRDVWNSSPLLPQQAQQQQQQRQKTVKVN